MTLQMRGEIQALLPAGVVAAELLTFSDAGQLFVEEEQAVLRAVESRRQEFRAGRDCARRALSQLGYSGAVLPIRPDRTVEWPPGIVGSITHTRDYAAAVAARSCDWGGVGIDAEVRSGVDDPKLWRYITTPEEFAWLGTLGDRAAAYATLLFSAKEAFYKAQYCLTARWLNFGDGQFHLTESGFEIELMVDLPRVGSRGSRLNGRHCEDEARVVTLVALLPNQ
jgi:4'-phosphopantetheinyl transferase EntD